MTNSKLAQRLLPIWFLCYTGLTWAASFAQDVRTFDLESLMWSAAAGVLGGALRTILSMASDQRAVYDIFRESRKDLVVALIAGMAAYIAVQAANSVMTTWLDMSAIPRDLRVLIIVGAGWSRMSFFGKLDRLTSAALNRVETRIKGTDPGPASEAAPLEK